jgi:hypothetical protein
MQSRTFRAAALGVIAAFAAIAVPSVASAASGDPAAVQASGASVPVNRPPGTPFLTNIDTLAALTSSGQLNPASRASFVLNIQGVAAVQQFTISVNPTCLSVKGKIGYLTGLAAVNGVGASPIAIRFADNTTLPPGSPDETPDRLAFSFNVDGLALTRCTDTDLLATFNNAAGAPQFPITTGFVIVHQDESPGVSRESGTTPNPIPAPNPVPLQNITPGLVPLAPTAPVATSPVVRQTIAPTSTTRRVCRRVTVRRSNGRVVRRHGRVVRRTVCRRVRV